MQALLAIPDLETLRKQGGPRSALMRHVAGVPLVKRILATAARADVDSVVLICPEGLDPAILEFDAQSPLLKNMPVRIVFQAGAFDPRNAAYWAAIEQHLDEEFLWLPWNFVTHKRALVDLTPSQAGEVILEPPIEGVYINAAADVLRAERFLVLRSGKPTDGIYSNFNRRLCRPLVRLLAHFPVTPNEITVVGLVAGVFAAFFFARGSYINYVAGALLFFVSGLIDEVDGMIARIKFLESAFGTWFEGFVDNATYLAIFAGITVGLHRELGNWAWNTGIALIAGSVLSVLVIAAQRKLATRRDRPNEYAGKMNRLMEADSSNLISKIVRQIHIFVKKGVLIHYLLLFTIVGGLYIFLWLAAIGANLTWIIALYFTRRFFRPASGAGLQPVTGVIK